MTHQTNLCGAQVDEIMRKANSEFIVNIDDLEKRFIAIESRLKGLLNHEEIFIRHIDNHTNRIKELEFALVNLEIATGNVTFATSKGES